ncbi:hypothetical protein [Dysgonomonas macrotermitis]|uniref:Uncharacterized protein n=1 Tax=Dysgonomonas macrotermitis TaxID=1346286 RepID=A0A1M4WXV6_9BACT|nr:hypothetical protein [Dysgonomonas macrotermitis]SHE85893.1 hypothetical protein SAMN05444362_102345 [Dysgonomonas macrotermitis]
MNKGILAFLIAGVLAVISFLVWKLLIAKKTSDVVTPSVPVPVNNPISSQSVNNIGGYVNVSPESTLDSDSVHTSSVLHNDSKGFSASYQETLTFDKTALSQRSNNPGALFWDGSTNWQGMNKSKTKSGAIMYFDNFDYGVRAQLMTLKNYFKKHGLNTLLGITTRYAPYGHESNDPAAYARTLASYLGIDVDTKFDLDVNRNMLAALGYFIHRVEAGYFWIPRSKYLEWAPKV